MRGGARENAGRKPLGTGSIDMLAKIKDEVNSHAFAEVDYQLNGETLKQKRVLLLLDKLFMLAMKDDVSAIREYLNRVLGKAVQPISGAEGGNVVVEFITPQKGICKK